MTEDEMVGWHHRLSGLEFEQTSGDGEGQGSLVCCKPWGRKELDTTEQLHFHFSLSRIREGNGNPLQCSCLENPGKGEPGGLPSMGFFGTLHSDVYIFPFLLCFSLLFFSQLFIRPPQPFCLSFS